MISDVTVVVIKCVADVTVLLPRAPARQPVMEQQPAVTESMDVVEDQGAELNNLVMRYC